MTVISGTTGIDKVQAGAVLFDDLPAGSVIQVANYTTGTMATTTTITPYDNTVPQSSEGTDIMTLSFTANKSNSKLKVDVIFNGSVTTNGGVMTLTLFKDTDASALGVSRFSGQANQSYCFTFSYYINAVDTSAHTYKIKLGTNTAGTVTFNGTNGVAEYGGAMASSITIMEIAQ